MKERRRATPPKGIRGGVAGHIGVLGWEAKRERASIPAGGPRTQPGTNELEEVGATG